MKKNSGSISEILKNLTMLSQLGLSLIMPLLLALGASWLIIRHTGAGNWVYIPGFILGLGASGTTAWKTAQIVMRKQDPNRKADDIGYNRHL